eukprot:gnl/TRDRNA2_/TRDRNA2_163762_c0_seq1.p1 gnl/TRDRNA2_/TRDRNA2_163762_c0~~gnl/TRDRNA2_/TRDRNA2_163762_c0_seq1.p1  ORF type:complete len:166 (-),score=38.23 gnl/TRDRNA2_/TRDRNA2_163762_c0_seq1:501-998(-)
MAAKKRKSEAARSDGMKRPRSSTFSDVQTFFFKKKDLRELSNFDANPVIVKGIRYPTGEHCFHAHKYLHAAEQCSTIGRAEELRRYSKRFRCGGPIAEDGLSAKRAGGKKGLALSDTEMRGWMPVAESIQMLICQSKLKAPQVRSCLLGTGDAYLLHQDNRAKVQ